MEFKDLNRENLESAASGGTVTHIPIGDLDKADLLAALVNYSHSRGLGIVQDNKKYMTIEEAREWVESGRSHDTAPAGHKTLYFDWVKGRPIKCDLSGDSMDVRLYDRDNGQGSAALVVQTLRAARIV